MNFNHKFVGRLLAQDVKGFEHRIYYLSRSLESAETNYSFRKLHYLGLVFATRSSSASQPSHEIQSSEVSFVLTIHDRTRHSMISPIDEFKIIIVTIGGFKVKFSWLNDYKAHLCFIDGNSQASSGR